MKKNLLNFSIEIREDEKKNYRNCNGMLNHF